MSRREETTRSEGVVVTGGARGIGYAIARAFVESGRNVVIADRDDVGSDAASELSALKAGRVTFIRADMRDVDSIRGMVRQANEELAGIDVLVNNAAVTRAIDFFDVSYDDWNQILEINSRGYFFALQEVARVMRKQGTGAVVNIASIAGKGWRETSNVAYAASKGSIITMTRIAAAALGRYGIRVNAVSPGMTRTQIWSNWLEGRADAEGRSAEDILAEITGTVPTGKLNTPADVADAVLFLASSAASNITGQSLNVDGGTIWD